MMERNSVASTTAQLLSVGALLILLLAGAAATEQSAAAKAHQKVLVYESSRPALRVSLTREGNAVIRATVSAPGLCGNGEKTTMGFEKAGADRWPIRSNGRFEHRNGSRSYLRGRFDGDRVIGVFRESRRRNIGGEEPEPTCGNVVPHGRDQRFVARLVKVNGKKVR